MARALDISIELEPGGAVFHRRFTRFVSELTDLSDVFEDLADDFGELEGRAFASQGGSSGGGWAPRKPPTGSWPILHKTGRLEASLTGPSVRQIGARQATFGSDVPYAGFHQTGTSRMVARPPVRLTSADKERWTKIIHRFLLKAATGR